MLILYFVWCFSFLSFFKKKYFTPVHVCIVKRLMCVWWAHEMVFTLGLLLCLYLRTERKHCPAGILLLSNIIQADYCDFFSFLKGDFEGCKQEEDQRSADVTNGPAEKGNLP